MSSNDVLDLKFREKPYVELQNLHRIKVFEPLPQEGNYVTKGQSALLDNKKQLATIKELYFSLTHFIRSWSEGAAEEYICHD